MSVEQWEVTTTLDMPAAVSPRQPRVCESPVCQDVSVLDCYEKLQFVILKQVISGNFFFSPVCSEMQNSFSMFTEFLCVLALKPVYAFT